MTRADKISMAKLPKHIRAHAEIYGRPADYPSDADFKTRFGAFFAPSEFIDKRTGLLIVDEVSVHLLVALRRACDFPFVVSSGTRSESTNREVGGHPTSAHMAGRAFDIKVKDGAQACLLTAMAFVTAMAFATGFKGIGVRRPSGGTGYVHVDDIDRPGDESVLWTYP